MSSSPGVTLVDYGMGNLFSVSRAFEYCGAKVEVTSDASRIESAERLVLPGVGAFPDGMGELARQGLVPVIRKVAMSGRPFLGICLGMQMMFDESYEYGRSQGLGLIPGKVIMIPPAGADGVSRKIPHIGWSRLNRRNGWEGTLLERASGQEWVYFVHSFMAEPADEKYRLADCLYDGVRIAAAVRKDSMCGVQFHPEKSGPAGLAILRSFLARKHSSRIAEARL